MDVSFFGYGSARLGGSTIFFKKKEDNRQTKRHLLTSPYPCDIKIKGKNFNALVNTVVLNVSDGGAGLEIIGVRDQSDVRIDEKILLEIDTGASERTIIKARIKWAKLSGLKNSIGVEFIDQRDIEKILHVV
ncbi:MAG: PilZ domain-containing protein [Planctomycetes bacterium]|nr:PilZ domain-containing protein [Planctomycetota bacterium]